MKKGKFSPEAQERLNALDDWTATCRVCGQKLSGTMKQIREHTHGEATASPQPNPSGD